MQYSTVHTVHGVQCPGPGLAQSPVTPGAGERVGAGVTSVTSVTQVLRDHGAPVTLRESHECREQSSDSKG